MGLSFSTEVGNGIRVSFPFAFVGYEPGYIRESDIHVFVRDSDPSSLTYNKLTEIVETYLFPSPNVVTLDTVIPSPVDGSSNIIVRRIMPKEEIYADVNSDDVFRKTSLNNSFIQMLYTQHEVLDGFNSDGSNDSFLIDELFGLTDRAILVPEGDPVTGDELLTGSVNERKNKLLGFDDEGNVTTVPIDFTSGDIFVLKEKLVIVNGVTEYTISNKSNGASVLLVDSRVQHINAYNLVDYTLTLSEPLLDTQEVEIWYQLNALPIAIGDALGSIGNPHLFNIIASLVSSTIINIGDWAHTLGSSSLYDGLNATYYFVANEDAGSPDGYYILDLTDKKGILMYQAPSAIETVEESNEPYVFSYPSSQKEREEMLVNAANNSIGYGGSTWWVRPCAIGRKENGIDVIYRGDTYGTPENRELEQGNTDEVLWTNRRLGEAVIKLTRLEMSATPSFSSLGLNDKLISYREDEHHQPGCWFNTGANGQLITAWGSRNSARDQNGVDVSATNYVKYGQDTDSLSVPETLTYNVTADYAQGFYLGNTSYLFQREDVGDWQFTRGSGGQNYLDPTPFFDSEVLELAGQFYFATAIADKTFAPDPQNVANRSKVHFFGSPHPTANPDNLLYYVQGEFILAGQDAAPFDGGGLYVKRVSDGLPVTGTNGRLDTNFVTMIRADMDVAYSPAGGQSYRLLDVQYGETPRALIAEFTFDWVHGESVPYGKTWDLKLVEWNGASWTVVTIKAGLRGALGYKPTSFNTGVGLGIEGYTSFYVHGASFYRGSDYNDLLPVIYYCDREGDDKSKHRLHKVTMNAGYTAINLEEVLVDYSKKILYRPEMTLGGGKRVLWFNEADGWSSFNSWVAKTRWLDETL